MQAEIAGLRAEVERIRALVESLSENGGGGYGGEFGLPIETPAGETQGAFRWEGGKITKCAFMFGRQVFELEDVEDANEDGRWSLVIPHETPGGATVERNTGKNTNISQTVVPLFEVSNGVIVRDWRGMPVVPVRE